MEGKQILSFLVFHCLFFRVTCSTGIPNGYISWKDPTQNRTDLLCPCSDRFCSDPSDISDKRCRCHARPLWEIRPNEADNIYLEYLSRRGGAVVVPSNNISPKNAQILDHQNGFLSQIPENICSYQSLVKIDFSGNKLTKLENINCLSNLDTLILRQNQIKTIHNDTFLRMTHLRVLDLAENEIKHIEPKAISDSSIGMYLVDFSKNLLTQIDITNMVIKQPFCEINYEKNQITELTNILSIEFNTDTTFGDGGFVNFEDNSFTTFPDFTKLGISDLKLLGKVLGFGFDFRGCKFTCDCKMEPFLELSKDIIKKIWRDYFDIKCFNPPELANQSIAWLTKEGQLDQFICNVSKSDNCPSGCHCYQQPSQDRTVVNCTNQNMTELPQKLPDDKNITLILTGNQITQLQNKSYFGRISVLDISDNKINCIPESVAKELTTNSILLNLHGNELTKIPSVFKVKDPCALNIGTINQTCGCEEEWQKQWLTSRTDQGCGINATQTTTINCITSSGIVPISEFNFKDLNCKSGFDYKSLTISIAILLLILSGLIVIAHYFRYEIFLLTKRLHVARKHRGQFKHDVYISVRENHGALISWIHKTLRPSLVAKNYNVYFPFIDVTIGAAKEEEIIKNINDSRNFLVVLSSDYTDEDEDTIWTNIEWKHAWNLFKEESHVRNIVIINYDQLQTKVFPIGPLKAYLRLGLDIDFANRKHNLLREVRDRLGLPNHEHSPAKMGFPSSKPMFSPQLIFKDAFSELQSFGENERPKFPYLENDETRKSKSQRTSKKYKNDSKNNVFCLNDITQTGVYSLPYQKPPTLVQIDISL